MSRKFAIAATAIVTALATSIFWIAAYNIMPAPERRGEPISAAGEIAIIDPQGSAPIAVAEGLVVGPSGMAIPVAGVSAQQLVDTFTQARAGGGRVHDAIDIIAPAGTPVVAATPGTVEKLYFSRGGGGITAYLRSEDGRWIYYYAHLQEYAPGLAEGQSVTQGQVIGRVGSTGNASARGPHLHFAVHQMRPQERWWEGTAVNPYPLLAGERLGGQPRGRGSLPKSGAAGRTVTE